jgi:sugar phosphate isomerase/epimerase
MMHREWPTQPLIGARAHDFGRGPATEIAAAVADAGALCVQLAPAKAIVDSPAPEDIEPAWASSVAQAFADRGISVAVLGSYVDVCGPDESSRTLAWARLSRCIELSSSFRTAVVGTETPLSGGSRKAAVGLLLAALERLLPEAERAGVLLCIEPVWGHAIDSPSSMAEIIRLAGSKALGVILDPVNLVDPLADSCPESAALKALDLFGDSVAAVHVKDYALRGNAKESAPPGTGLMDWERVAPAAAIASHNAPFLVEEQSGSGFSMGLSLLRGIFGQAV